MIGGLAYDRITFPENFRTAPVSGNDKTDDQISPKAGMIWTPLEDTAVRFAYTRSLSGASLDQSYQIEPSQVAGFIQNYRSVIPESIAGGNAGASFETFDLSLEQKFRTGTYLAISGEILYSTVNRVDGAFDYNPFSFRPPTAPSGLNENLDYQEKSLQFTANQLLGRNWALGAQYRVSEAVLNDNYVDVPDGGFSSAISSRGSGREGTLNQVDLTAIYNHPCGFFAEGEALWFDQSNGGYTPAEPGDDFWQFNLFAGWRFPRRKAEAVRGPAQHCRAGLPAQPAEHLQRTAALAHPCHEFAVEFLAGTMQLAEHGAATPVAESHRDALVARKFRHPVWFLRRCWRQRRRRHPLRRGRRSYASAVSFINGMIPIWQGGIGCQRPPRFQNRSLPIF